MVIHVKDIVSNECKTLICNELKRAGIEFILNRTEEVDKLEITFSSSGPSQSYYSIEGGIEQKEKKIQLLLQNVKAEILHLIHYSKEPLIINLSAHLSEKFNYDYTYLANLFSNKEGITIERFVIVNKIERVKQLLGDATLTVTDVAMLMHYSSLSHLSSQFKKVTGITTTQFRKRLASI